MGLEDSKWGWKVLSWARTCKVCIEDSKRGWKLQSGVRRFEVGVEVQSGVGFGVVCKTRSLMSLCYLIHGFQVHIFGIFQCAIESKTWTIQKSEHLAMCMSSKQ